ncbi:MAG: class I SAM-dependent methyltransferase [Actinomycetota bacterium]|nr:class I SAM-dependent methyltransferase [Actinomycetota bacterium]
MADGVRWLASASADDHDVLARAGGPVVDVGCGPRRHVRALVAAGVDVLGIDLTPSVLVLARDRGTPVLAVSVFDTLPRMGEWQTALLLDGNSALGGDPLRLLRLLRRLRSVLAPEGQILTDPVSGSPPALGRLRLRHGGTLGGSARVGKRTWKGGR